MVTIKDYKINPTKKVIEATNVQVVYIPLISKWGYNYNPVVTIGTYVYVGSILGIDNINNIPLLSSVSGTIVGFDKKYISNGALVDCIVIENDFKDKYLSKNGKKQNLSKYTKEEFINILRNTAITGLSGNDYPTYLKYQNAKEIKYLIINGMECEIYSSCDNARMYQNPEEILEGIDAIMEIMHIDSAYIGINENNHIIIKKFLKYINTYPNIKIYPVTDAYPMGYERFLINEILGLTYNKYPSEVGVITDNVNTIYAIYEALKYHEPLTKRIVTISGNNLKNAGNYQVRIGTNFKEIVEKYHLYSNINNSILVAGGALMGKSIQSDDLIITKDLTTILVLKDDFEPASPCIKCGKCTEVCPMNLIPSSMIENKDINKSQCIQCGLCSYVCPSKIEVRDYLNK